MAVGSVQDGGPRFTRRLQQSAQGQIARDSGPGMKEFASGGIPGVRDVILGPLVDMIASNLFVDSATGVSSNVGRSMNACRASESVRHRTERGRTGSFVSTSWNDHDSRCAGFCSTRRRTSQDVGDGSRLDAEERPLGRFEQNEAVLVRNWAGGIKALAWP
jgi:hypothetical protein